MREGQNIINKYIILPTHCPNLVIRFKLVHNAGGEEREVGGVGGAVGERSKVKEVVSAAFPW